MDTASTSLELSESQFLQIRQLVYRLCGINLIPGKEELVKSRLAKRLRALGLSGFEQYLQYVERDKSRQELASMIDALTTNKTSFFREAQHFDYLRHQVLPGIKKMKEGRRLRIWSAGCSSGEEPYSIALVLREEIPDIDRWDARILATDISTKMLAKAREAIYGQEELREVPASLLQKYFTCIRIKPPRSYQVKDNVRALIRFSALNLMAAWPMKGPFQVIFCRNVMIYFDKQTQQELVNRFGELLEPGGHLFLGHSESLTGSAHAFRYVQPAVYMK
jgi:chemotaxis protein methyltransferase CheR